MVDETDRLLKQSYQEWLPRVLDEIKQGQNLGGGGGNSATEVIEGLMPFGNQR